MMHLLELLGAFLGGFVAGACAVLRLQAPSQRALVSRLQVDERMYVVRTSDKENIDPPLYLSWLGSDWALVSKDKSPSKFLTIDQADAARKVFNRAQKERKHLIIDEADNETR